jgi:hypothetical protein
MTLPNKNEILAVALYLAPASASAIRNKIGLSRTEFERLCDREKIVCVSGQNLKKCRLTGTIILEIR